MKKNGGTRTSATRMSQGTEQEPWRMWVLTTLALGFSLLVITLLTRENKMLLTTVNHLKTDAQKSADVSSEENPIYTELPLHYTSGASAVAHVSRGAFTVTAEGLAQLGGDCGTTQSSAHYADIANQFSGAEKIVYTFSYVDPTQDGNYVVTVVPNTPRYTKLEDFQKDFDICGAGGDLYPQMMSEDWLVFTNSCGSGYDDGSGLPHGCEIMREAIEPTLQLP